MRWSILTWSFVIFIDISIVLAVWAALPTLATVLTSIFLALATFFAYLYSALRITITQGWLLVGPAAIERAFIYNFKELGSSQMRAASGVAAHPNEFLQLRFWVRTGVKLQLRDPRDPTPAWLFSSKNPDKLVSVLSNPQH
jgi:Protein of unknown function (DUF3093)